MALESKPNTPEDAATAPQSADSPDVVVHPLVLLSVVDHYNRVNKGTSGQRVVGVILGESRKGQIDCLSSFAVPFDEDNRNKDVWFIDMNYVETFLAMSKKVNAKERIIGWYSTGPKIKQVDMAINEMFKKYVKSPTFVIVDVAPKEGASEIPTKAYRAVQEIKDDGTPLETTFQHLQCEIGALEAEEIGVEHLLRDVKDVNVSTLTHKVSEKISSLKALKERLEEIKVYLTRVASGEMPINHEVTQLLQEVINLMPNLQIESLLKSFTVKTNDMMLVIYLASLIRSILALHAVINNKVSLKEEEAKAIKASEKDAKASNDSSKGGSEQDKKDTKDDKKSS